MRKTCLAVAALLCCLLMLGVAGCHVERGPWVKLHPKGGPPPERAGHSMVYDPSSGKVILFGGYTDKGAYFNDTWAYDPATNTWTNLLPTGELPPERWGQSMVYEETTSQVILFGGFGQEEPHFLNDTWAYDPQANTWRNLNPQGDVPSGRRQHSMVYCPDTGKVVLFGGYAPQNPDPPNLKDTWAYDPLTNVWANLHPTGTEWDTGWNDPGYYPLAYDPATRNIISCGGKESSGPGGPVITSAYDPVANTWTKLAFATDLPINRAGHIFVYDPTTGRIILCGGAGGGSRIKHSVGGFSCSGYEWSEFPDWAYPEDMWGYDPVANTWTALHNVGRMPETRDCSAAVFDPASGRLILFGGEDPRNTPLPRTFSNETWACDLGQIMGDTGQPSNLNSLTDT